jgi:hypothetical protein
VASLTAGRVGVRVVRRGTPVVARTGGRVARTTGRTFVRAGGLGRDLLARRRVRGGAVGVPDEPVAPSPVDEGESEVGIDRG